MPPNSSQLGTHSNLAKYLCENNYFYPFSLLVKITGRWFLLQLNELEAGDTFDTQQRVKGDSKWQK